MDDKIIHEKQDLTYLEWSRYRHSSGTAGSFLKAYSDLEGIKKYYKLSAYDVNKGVFGHECINEIIADRLQTLLGIEHVSYQLIHADIIVDEKEIDTYVCVSEDFKKPGESKIAFEDFFQIYRNADEKELDFCVRMGWRKQIDDMLLLDYLILNRDRHGANLEVLKNGTYRLAPLYDHGLSLLFSCETEQELKEYDVMQDKKVQCFVGSNSTLSNLSLIS